MVRHPSALVLLGAILVQNLAEYRAGGPDLPPGLAALLPAGADRAAPAALIVVSLLAALVLVPVAGSRRRGWHLAGAATAAMALTNAAAQAAASVGSGALVPGTLAGLTLMAPAALWLMWRLRPALGGGTLLAAGVMGAALMPLLLLAVWTLATGFVPR